MPSNNPLTGQPWKAEESNVNPFSGQTVDPTFANITQEDYAGSLWLNNNRPVLNSSAVSPNASSTPTIPTTPTTPGATPGSSPTLTGPRPTDVSTSLPNDIFQPQKTRSLEDIRKEQLQQAQTMIDATQSVYLAEMDRLKSEGAARLGQTSGMAIGAGLAGSPFQGAQEEKTREYTNKVLGAAEGERRAQVASIMASAFEKSTAQYDKEQARYLNERQQYVSERDTYQKQQKDKLEADKSAAVTSIKNIAAGGFSLGEMPEADYKALLEKSGLSDFEAKALYNTNTPQANGKTEIQDGQLVTYYIDPKTGKPSFSTIALPEGLQKGNLETITTDEGVFIYDKSNPKKDENGNYIMQRVGAPKGTENLNDLLSVSEAKALGVKYGTTKRDALGVSPVQETNSELVKLATDLRKEFANTDEVKKFSAVDTSYKNMLAVLPDAKTGKVAPAKDAMVILFNKMLDPGSVVKESEFARTQEGQAALTKASEQLKQLVQGGAGISPEVIQQMADTAKNLYGVAQKSYKPTEDFYRSLAVDAGLDPNKVIRTIAEAGEENTQNQQFNEDDVKSALKATLGREPTQQEVNQILGKSNPLSMGQNGSLQVAVTQKFPEASQGGQCGDFAHKIVQFPSVGDSKSEKIASVNKFGIGKKEWQKQGPQVGDVLITNENPTYGHVAVVTSISPNGSLVLSESNYKQKTYGREKVSHGRVISPNSAAIYGVIRGTIKV